MTKAEDTSIPETRDPILTQSWFSSFLLSCVRVWSKTTCPNITFHCWVGSAQTVQSRIQNWDPAEVWSCWWTDRRDAAPCCPGPSACLQHPQVVVSWRQTDSERGWEQKNRHTKKWEREGDREQGRKEIGRTKERQTLTAVSVRVYVRVYVRVFVGVHAHEKGRYTRCFDSLLLQTKIPQQWGEIKVQIIHLQCFHTHTHTHTHTHKHTMSVAVVFLSCS